MPDDDDDDDDDEGTVFYDGAVSCEIYGGQNHSHYGNITTYSKSCNIKNKNDGINIFEKDNDDGSNIGAICCHTVVENNKPPDENGGSSKSNDDSCDHGTVAKSELVNKSDLSSSVLVINDDGNKVSDHTVVVDNRQSDDKCGDNGSVDNQGENIGLTKKETTTTSPLLVSNDNSGNVSDHAVVGNDKQPCNKCTSNDGGDNEQDGNVGHNKSEPNNENESTTLSVSSDDSGNVCSSGVDGNSEQSDSKCGKYDAGGNNDTKRDDTKNELNNDNAASTALADNDDQNFGKMQ